MARIVGDMDLKFEEALMENEARNKINRQHAKWEKEHLSKSRWSRFIERVKVSIRYEIHMIRSLIKNF